MYIILVKENNELHASYKERIMQRSKLVDNLLFLVDPDYKGLDMTTFSATLEYITPISKEYHSESLTLLEELYEEKKLQYQVPFDTSLTVEPGDIELQLTFVKADIDDEGRSVQYIRKTSPIKIKIIPIAAWSDIIPDSALNALDQKILAIDARINELLDISGEYSSSKADNIVLDTESSEMYLTSSGIEIGNRIKINDLGNAIAEDTKDGVIKMII